MNQQPQPVPSGERLDAWIRHHPWHPRFLPFLIYILFLSVIPAARDFWPPSYVILYTIQCALVVIVLWRYHDLLPELNWRFHWLAIPVGVGVAGAWIALGWLMAGQFPERWQALLSGQPQPNLADPDAKPLDFRDPALMGPTLGWIALGLRLVGMSVVVPMFEELFIRSLLLRSLHSLRRTGIGIVQIVQDLPVIGEWLMGTRLGARADKHPPVFGQEFERHPLGALSLFGVCASTAIFTSYHHRRDWPGCVVCGVAYCLLVAATNRRQPGSHDRGLGPVIWAHGITNALLWVYTLRTGDWQFL